MSTIAYMPSHKRETGKTPRNDPRKGDRHKPSRAVRVRSVYLRSLDALAERNGTTGPEEVNRALRELLEREGLWPKRKDTP